MRPDVSEKELQSQIVQLAKLQGWRVQFTWSSVHSPAGWPDLILCRPPVLLAFELKSAKGRVTAEQQRWLDDLTACGVPAFVLRPADWDQIVSLLKLPVRSAGHSCPSAAGVVCMYDGCPRHTESGAA